MPKPFLFILDPLAQLSAKTDTSLALIQEANRRNIPTYACELRDIIVTNGHLSFLAAQVSLEPEYSSPPTYQSVKRQLGAEEFSAIFMRKDPPVDEAFVTALWMLRCYAPAEVTMINRPDGMLLANEKLFGQKIASKFCPITVTSCAQDVLLDFIQEHERVVLKPLLYGGGSGILVFERDDKNLLSALDLLTQSFSKPIQAQKYIEKARLGDKRVIVLGGNPVGAIKRIPSEFDHRANCHIGGKAEPALVDDRDKEIVQALKPHLIELGLHLVGIDVIDGYLTEINVTSPTLVIEIEALSQKKGEKPLRAQIIDYIETLIA